MQMLESRSFEEWIVFFVKINLLLITIFFMFVPMFSWLIPAILCLLVHFLGPSFVNRR